MYQYCICTCMNIVWYPFVCGLTSFVYSKTKEEKREGENQRLKHQREAFTIKPAIVDSLK